MYMDVVGLFEIDKHEMAFIFYALWVFAAAVVLVCRGLNVVLGNINKR